MALDPGFLEQLFSQGVGKPGGMAAGGGLPATSLTYGNLGLPYAPSAPLSGAPATNDLFRAMFERGPYAGGRGWLQGGGAPAALGMGQQGLAVPGGMPAQVPRVLPTGTVGLPAGGGVQAALAQQMALGQGSPVPFAANGPGPIPAGAGAVGPLPYAPPVSTQVSGIPAGINSSIPQSLYNPGTPFANNGAGPVPGGVGAAGRVGATADDMAPAWRSYFARGGTGGGGGGAVPPTTAVAGAADDAAGGAGRIRGLLGRFGGAGGATAGAEGAARTPLSFLRGGGGWKGALGRAGVGVGLGYGLDKLAGALGEDNVAGQFAEGAAIGAPVGMLFGGPGAAVGGLGVGLGNALTGGRFADLVSGGEPTELDKVAETTDPTTYTIMRSLNDPTDDTFGQLGVDPELARGIQGKFEEEVGAATTETERIAALQHAAESTMAAASGGAGAGMGEPQGMDPRDVAAMQIMASQLFAPVAADSAAIGNMQASALGAIAPDLPAAYQPLMAQLQQHATEGGNRMANAYIQQAGAIPQIHALGRQQALQDQVAGQLASQAIGGMINPASSGGLSDLLTGATMPGGAAGGQDSASIVAALANGQQLPG